MRRARVGATPLPSAARGQTGWGVVRRGRLAGQSRRAPPRSPPHAAAAVATDAPAPPAWPCAAWVCGVPDSRRAAGAVGVTASSVTIGRDGRRWGAEELDATRRHVFVGVRAARHRTSRSASSTAAAAVASPAPPRWPRTAVVGRASTARGWDGPREGSLAFRPVGGGRRRRLRW